MGSLSNGYRTAQGRLPLSSGRLVCALPHPKTSSAPPPPHPPPHAHPSTSSPTPAHLSAQSCCTAVHTGAAASRSHGPPCPATARSSADESDPAAPRRRAPRIRTSAPSAPATAETARDVSPLPASAADGNKHTSQN